MRYLPNAVGEIGEICGFCRPIGNVCAQAAQHLRTTGLPHRIFDFPRKFLPKPSP
jgi:hypothetical protein